MEMSESGELPSISTKNDQDILTSDYFEGKCTDLAQDFIGKLLLHRTSEGMAGGIIVETEAYLGANDPACHLASGRTKRTKPFFGGKGTIYVFKIYRHSNLNIITECNSHPECILIRALEPTHGIKLMKKRRGTENLTELTTGPGKLTEALGITKENLNNTPLDDCPMEIRKTNFSDFEVIRTGRVGLSTAEDWPLRYTMRDNEFLSKNVQRPLDLSLDFSTYYKELHSETRLTLPESISRD